jgi:hypothetical protein
MKNRLLVAYWVAGFIASCALFPLTLFIYVVFNINLLSICREEADYYVNVIDGKVTYYYVKSTIKFNDTPLRYVIYVSTPEEDSMYCWTYTVEDARKLVSMLNNQSNS